ncbi:MAG: hypothetical protein KIH64_009690 [Mycobacterium sp.]|nr:hypothetical protein [Mycobacterium sp.]
MRTESGAKRQGLFRRTEGRDHRLAFLDHTAFELLRVTGRAQLVQVVWIYEHPVDQDGIRRFHRNFSASIANRLIEPSPLPFGRPRWVLPAGPAPQLRMADAARPRDELLDWADELTDISIDPQNGPGFCFAVQPFDDGSTAVSIVASHCIGDGIGGVMAIFEAVTGQIRDFGYERSGSRSRLRGILTDFAGAVRDLPMTARTVVKAVKTVRANRAEFARARAAQASAGDPDGTHIFVPTTVIFVDVAEWDAKAQSLGGNSYSLLGGFAARIADHLGRHRPDGNVSLLIAINLRESLDDDRALAMAFASATVDPKEVLTDLTGARNAVREAREKTKSEPDTTMELLPLLPFLPRGAAKGVADLLFSYSEDLPVSCSNLGDLPPDTALVDGTPAEYMFLRGVDKNVTLGEMQRSLGQVVVVSGRINGKISISVEAYELGGQNTASHLRDIAGQVLAEYGLTGVIT